MSKVLIRNQFFVLHFASLLVTLFAGAAYIDLPATLLTTNVDESKIVKVLPCPPPPLSYPDVNLIERAVNLLVKAKRPLVIIGKGKSMNLQKIFIILISILSLSFSAIFCLLRSCLRSSGRSSERTYLFDRCTLFTNSDGKGRCT